jgi:hypothetical protein
MGVNDFWSEPEPITVDQDEKPGDDHSTDAMQLYRAGRIVAEIAKITGVSETEARAAVQGGLRRGHNDHSYGISQARFAFATHVRGADDPETETSAGLRGPGR